MKDRGRGQMSKVQVRGQGYRQKTGIQAKRQEYICRSKDRCICQISRMKVKVQGCGSLSWIQVKGQRDTSEGSDQSKGNRSMARNRGQRREIRVTHW